MDSYFKPDDSFCEVLDIGCATGNYCVHLKKIMPDTKYYGCDPSEAMINKARELHPRGLFSVDSLPSLSFPDQHFDLTVCRGGVMMLPPLKQSIKEIVRVTRKTALIEFVVAPKTLETIYRGAAGGSSRVTIYSFHDIARAYSEVVKPLPENPTHASTLDPVLGGLPEVKEELTIVVVRWNRPIGMQNTKQ